MHVSLNVCIYIRVDSVCMGHRNPGSEKGRASACGCWGVYVCVCVCGWGGEAKGPPLVDSLTDDMH